MSLPIQIVDDDTGKFVDKQIAFKSIESDIEKIQVLWDQVYDREIKKVHESKLPLFEYREGDMVLVATRNAGLASTHNKLSGSWGGPYQIVKVVNSLVYEVCLLGYDPTSERLPAGAKQNVHAERIAMFSSKKVWTPLDVEELERLAQYDARSYTVDKVVAWRKSDEVKGRLEFRVRWSGFSDPRDDTWEPEDRVCAEPALVRATVEYCKKHKTKGHVARCLKRLTGKQSGAEEGGASVPQRGVTYTPTHPQVRM